MRLPVEWLKEYVDLPLSDAELANMFTMSGSEVEGIHDGVFEVKVTPNRGDTLSVVGMAIEAAALTRQQPRLPKPTVPEDAQPHQPFITIRIDAPELCARYAARLVADVRIGPSPEWMQRRLIQAGMRPINNVVDITNYVMMELGQPLHAFDYDLLASKTIIVRTAAPGEEITTLDGVQRQLHPEILVIADAERPVAIAGIMGGAETEVTDRTTRILLESAHFSPLCIRRGAKRLGMSTEASFRFERWVDPSGTVLALDRAVELMRELGVASVVPGVEDCYVRRYAPVTITLRPERCNAILGTCFPPSFMAETLSALGLRVSGSAPLEVTVPTRRGDIQSEIDLIEEVARIAGYDRIPFELPHDNLIGRHSDWQLTSDLIRRVLAGAGLNEAVSHTLTDPALVAHLYDGTPVRLRNPNSEEFSVLRPSLLPLLAGAARLSASRGARDIALFEVGRIFVPAPDGLVERFSAAGLITGSLMGGRWNMRPVALQADFYLCKGVVEDLLRSMNVANAAFEPERVHGFHPGRAARIVVGGERAGVMGQLHPEVRDALELPGDTYVFELDPDVLTRHANPRKYHPLPRFPAVQRDIAFVVDAHLPAAEAQRVILDAGAQMVESATVFDAYQGEHLPEGKKSLAFSLVLRSQTGTLTDEAAEAVVDRIRAALATQLGATPR